MFTGIVEELGTVLACDPGTGRVRVGATLVLEDAKVGDSIALDGCCLTVVEVGDGWWAADAVAETFARTTLGDRRPGDPVNLERPLRLADRVGGHLVAGHVDAVGTILAPAPDLDVTLPPALARYVVEKGSIALDGCSLTVVEAGADHFTVAVVPHTAEVTTLGRKGKGDRVNLEVDLVAKHVERLLAPHRETKG